MLELALSIEDQTEGFKHSLYYLYYLNYVCEIIDGLNVPISQWEEWKY